MVSCVGTITVEAAERIDGAEALRLELDEDAVDDEHRPRTCGSFSRLAFRWSECGLWSYTPGVAGSPPVGRCQTCVFN